MSEQLAIDEIVLKVPACAAYARIIRVGAAALGLRQGMSFTEIDELRAAIDAAMTLLLAEPADETAAISCRFRTSPGCLELEASRTDGASVDAPAVARFKEAVSRSNLTAAVDADRGLLHLSKRRGQQGPSGAL